MRRTLKVEEAAICIGVSAAPGGCDRAEGKKPS